MFAPQNQVVEKKETPNLGVNNGFSLDLTFKRMCKPKFEKKQGHPWEEQRVF